MLVRTRSRREQSRGSPLVPRPVRTPPGWFGRVRCSARRPRGRGRGPARAGWGVDIVGDDERAPARGLRDQLDRHLVRRARRPLGLGIRGDDPELHPTTGSVDLLHLTAELDGHPPTTKVNTRPATTRRSAVCALINCSRTTPIASDSSTNPSSSSTGQPPSIRTVTARSTPHHQPRAPPSLPGVPVKDPLPAPAAVTRQHSVASGTPPATMLAWTPRLRSPPTTHRGSPTLFSALRAARSCASCATAMPWPTSCLPPVSTPHEPTGRWRSSAARPRGSARRHWTTTAMCMQPAAGRGRATT